MTLGDVQADIERGQVTKNGADVYLTALEYRLLLVFVNNRGKVLVPQPPAGGDLGRGRGFCQ